MSTNIESSVPAPMADWVTMDHLVADPESAAERLLRESPIAFVPFIGGLLISSYHGIQEMMNDPAKHTVVNSDGGTTDRAVGPSLMRREGEQHVRQRKQIMPSLRPSAVERGWNKVFSRNAQKRLRELVEAGPGANLDRVFARPFAADNLAAIVGLPNLTHEDVVRWSHAMTAGSANIFDDAAVWVTSDAANVELDAIIDGAIPYVRDHPDESMLSAMLRADDQLPVEAIRANVKLAISGGVNEPQHMVVNGVWAFTKYAVDAADADAATFARAFDEVARLFPPISMIGKRSRTEGYDLDGVWIPGDTTLVTFLLAANRDPEQYDRPTEFDIDRERKGIMSFGSGPHVCAGSNVAKAAVAGVAWPHLYAALPGLRAIDPHVVAPTGWVFRSLPALPVTWDRVVLPED